MWIRNWFQCELEIGSKKLIRNWIIFIQNLVQFLL
jgi:hypothetical protein